MGKRTHLHTSLAGQVKPRNGRQVDRIEIEERPPEKMLVATDEQAARYTFQAGPVQTEHGITIGFAHRRRPLIETLAKTLPWLTTRDLEALRYFRMAHDRAARSETKSCLNVRPGGVQGYSNGSEMLAITPAIAEAKRQLAGCERALGAVLSTMRAVALDDRTFSDVAIERSGSRPRSYIEDQIPAVHAGKVSKGGPGMRKVFREKLEPKSGRHRQIIADEFKDGVRRLTAHVHGYRPIAGAVVPPPPTAAGLRVTVSEAISDAIARAQARHITPAALLASASVVMDIARENDVAVDEVPTAFMGLPIIEQAAWAWGWLLIDAAYGGTEEMWVDPNVDGCAAILRGGTAPLGAYRVWGPTMLVAHAWAGLVVAYGGALAFKTARDACEALAGIATELNLHRTDAEELAA